MIHDAYKSMPIENFWIAMVAVAYQYVVVLQRQF